MGGQPRRKRRTWPLVLASLLALVLAATAVMVRPVPKVTGRPQADAVARLPGAGLHAPVRREVSDTPPAGPLGAAPAPVRPPRPPGGQGGPTGRKGPDGGAGPAP